MTWWARSDSPIKVRTYYTGGNSGVSFTTNATWTFYNFPNSLFTANMSGAMQVIQFQIQSGGSTTDLYIDDIQWVVRVVSALRLHPPLASTQTDTHTRTRSHLLTPTRGQISREPTP